MTCRKLLEMQRNAMERHEKTMFAHARLQAFYDLMDIQHAINEDLHAPGCGCEPDDDDEDDTPIYVDIGGQG